MALMMIGGLATVGMGMSTMVKIREIAFESKQAMLDERARRLAERVRAGKERLIVIADFDRTISRYRTSSGAPVTTSHGVIENCELLDETYRKKARDLADYYIPKEFDASSSEEERTKVCEEWWSKAHDLLLEYGLTRQQLEDAVRNETNLELREGCEEMFRMLEKNGVPLLIFSAGLGDVIETFLRTKVFARTGKIPSNIHIISNRMRFESIDLDGWKDDFDTPLLGNERTGKIKPSNIKIDRLVGFEGEIIHSCNKGLTPMRELEAKGVFKNRTTALLLGDSVGDVHMADWLMGSGYVRSRVCERVSSLIQKHTLYSNTGT